MSKYVFTKSRLNFEPASPEMDIEEIVCEAHKRHPEYSEKSIKKWTMQLEPENVLSYFMIKRVS